jgi:hypothetical protein
MNKNLMSQKAFSSIALLSFSCCLITSCSTLMLFTPDHVYYKTADGRRVRRDSSVDQATFKSIISRRINDEVAGRKPEGGVSSWNEKWLSQIQSLRRGYGDRNHEYIDYIISERNRHNLPKIKGL